MNPRSQLIRTSRAFAFLLASLSLPFAGACGDDSGQQQAGPDGGSEVVPDEPIALEAYDLIGNDTTLFALSGSALVAIDPESQETTTLWPLPELAIETGEEVVEFTTTSAALLFADAQHILLRVGAAAYRSDGLPIGSTNTLWKVSLTDNTGTQLRESRDSRDFRGATIAGDRVYTNGPYSLFSIALSDGQTPKGFEPQGDGNWVSNPLVDAEGTLWFARNSSLFRVNAEAHSGGRIPAAFDVPGSFTQEATLLPSDDGSDFTVWAPMAGYYQVDPSAAAAPSVTPVLENYYDAVRLGDTLVFCGFSGVWKATASGLESVEEDTPYIACARQGEHVFAANGEQIVAISGL